LTLQSKQALIGSLGVKIHDGVVVLACDLPLVTADVVGAIVGAWAGEAVVAPMGPRGPEPLCALWSVRAFPQVEAAAHGATRSPRRLLEELGDAGPDLDEERLSDNYLALFDAAKRAGRPADGVAMGLTLGLLVRTFGPLPGQARPMLARLVKANGPTAVIHAAVTTVGSTIGADPKYADDPLGPVRYLSGVVRGGR
jgi:hypothetical protein